MPELARLAKIKSSSKKVLHYATDEYDFSNNFSSWPLLVSFFI